MRRFYSEPIGSRTEVLLDTDQTHHMCDVLRLSPGDEVILFDGSGIEFRSTILEFLAGRARCRIDGRTEIQSEMCLEVVVCQAVIKGDHFDYAVQKSVETGAASIQPFVSARCVKVPKNPERFLERAQRIANAAAKQCGRARVPKVENIISFEMLVSWSANVYTIFAYENEKARSLKELLSAGCPGFAAVVVGPEGGFTVDEATSLIGSGAHAVSLGPRILRAETAAPYVLAQLDYACCR